MAKNSWEFCLTSPVQTGCQSVGFAMRGSSLCTCSLDTCRHTALVFLLPSPEQSACITHRWGRTLNTLSVVPTHSGEDIAVF